MVAISTSINHRKGCFKSMREGAKKATAICCAGPKLGSHAVLSSSSEDHLELFEESSESESARELGTEVCVLEGAEGAAFAGVEDAADILH